MSLKILEAECMTYSYLWLNWFFSHRHQEATSYGMSFSDSSVTTSQVVKNFASWFDENFLLLLIEIVLSSSYYKHYYKIFGWKYHSYFSFKTSWWLSQWLRLHLAKLKRVLNTSATGLFACSPLTALFFQLFTIFAHQLSIFYGIQVLLVTFSKVIHYITPWYYIIELITLRKQCGYL